MDADRDDDTQPESPPAPASPEISDFERQIRGPLWGYKGAALLGLVATIPFASKPSLATPLQSFGLPAVAFVVGFVWVRSIMALIHWIGLQSEWTPLLKRRVLIAAFLAGPMALLVGGRIVGG